MYCRLPKKTTIFMELSTLSSNPPFLKSISGLTDFLSQKFLCHLGLLEFKGRRAVK